jgi:hypothetical protein
MRQGNLSPGSSTPQFKDPPTYVHSAPPLCFRLIYSFALFLYYIAYLLLLFIRSIAIMLRW